MAKYVAALDESRHAEVKDKVTSGQWRKLDAKPAVSLCGCEETYGAFFAILLMKSDGSISDFA